MNKISCFLITKIFLSLLFLVLANENFAAPIQIDVDLPSTSTGIPNGTLAVRIFAPSTISEARYPEGAPVIIFAHGGESAGVLTPQLGRAEDVIRILFLYPGGSNSGRTSSGVYDYRGANSIAAMRDVILYAAGVLRDNQNRLISQVLPVPVLHRNIGIFGSSNGGNMVAAVAAQHGTQLRGYLRYGIQWESPVSSQVAVGDIGRTRLECTTPGQPISIDNPNPHYNPAGYTPTALAVNYSSLRYDPTNTRTPIFWDGNGDGRFTTIADPNHAGCTTPDLNLNGVLEITEDRALTSYTFNAFGKIVYSRQAAQAIASLGIMTTWAANIATVAETEAFWNLREAVQIYDEATINIPDYEGMSLAGLTDHVQISIEKPHVHQAFDGWNNHGHWVKINPSRSYAIEEDPSLASRTDLPENAPNVPVNWDNPANYAYPDDLEQTYWAAGIHEMADRARNRPFTGDATAPTVQLLSPNGGRFYRRGQSVLISWTASDNVAVAAQEIQISTNGGASYTTIASNLSATTNSHVWTIPMNSTRSKGYIVRVKAFDATGNVGYDNSDGFLVVR